MGLSCHVLHSIQGRTRLYVPAIKNRAAVAEHPKPYATGQQGIRAAATNCACASLVIPFEPMTWTATSLCEHLSQLTLDEVMAYQPTNHQTQRGPLGRQSERGVGAR